MTLRFKRKQIRRQQPFTSEIQINQLIELYISFIEPVSSPNICPEEEQISKRRNTMGQVSPNIEEEEISGDPSISQRGEIKKRLGLTRFSLTRPQSRRISPFDIHPSNFKQNSERFIGLEKEDISPKPSLYRVLYDNSPRATKTEEFLPLNLLRHEKLPEKKLPKSSTKIDLDLDSLTIVQLQEELEKIERIYKKPKEPGARSPPPEENPDIRPSPYNFELTQEEVEFQEAYIRLIEEQERERERLRSLGTIEQLESSSSFSSKEDLTPLFFNPINLESKIKKLLKYLSNTRIMELLSSKFMTNELLRNLLLQRILPSPENLDSASDQLDAFFSESRFPKFNYSNLKEPKFSPLADYKLSKSENRNLLLPIEKPKKFLTFSEQLEETIMEKYGFGRFLAQKIVRTFYNKEEGLVFFKKYLDPLFASIFYELEGHILEEEETFGFISEKLLILSDMIETRIEQLATIYKKHFPISEEQTVNPQYKLREALAKSSPKQQSQQPFFLIITTVTPIKEAPTSPEISPQPTETHSQRPKRYKVNLEVLEERSSFSPYEIMERRLKFYSPKRVNSKWKIQKY